MDSLGTRTWALHDALGSVRQTLDDAGAALSPTGYASTPFGVVRSGAEPAPFGFTGELHSEDLLYLRARWYDPGSGTFLGRDPFAGFPTRPYSLHPYQYGYSDPVRWTDPSGENPLAVPAAGLTALEIAFLLASGAITLTTLQVCVVQQQCDAIWDAWEGHKADVRRGFDYLTNRESYVWTGGGSATARTPPQGDNSLPPQIVTLPHGVAHPWPTIRSFPLPQETGAGCWLPFPLVNPTAGPLHTGFPLPQEPPVVVLEARGGLVGTVKDHLNKLSANPQSRDRNHWLTEINAALNDLHRKHPGQSLSTILQRQGFSEGDIERFIEGLQIQEFAARSQAEAPGGAGMGIQETTVEKLRRNLENLRVELWDW